MALTVKDGSIDIDFEGSSPQVERAINVCLAYTTAYTAFGVTAVLAPHIPNNEGVLRPITIRAPLGSIVNSKPPAAGSMRGMIGQFGSMMVIQALSEVIPDRVIATVGSPTWCTHVTGHRADGSPFANLFFTGNGYGASNGRDGLHVVSWPSNVASTPVEMIEQQVPMKVHYRRLRVGTGGKGQFRGGNGQEILFESKAPGLMTVTFLAERTRPETAPAGVAGGEPGAWGEVIIDGVAPKDLKQQYLIQAGGTVLVRTPAGGGYGVPGRRSAEHIERDRVDGYV
jgi:N-methylhydantoinase B